MLAYDLSDDDWRSQNTLRLPKKGAIRTVMRMYAEGCKFPQGLPAQPPKFVIHALDTESSVNKMSIDALLPRDASKIRMLQEVCYEIGGFEVFIARVRKVWTDPRHDRHTSHANIEPGVDT